MQIPVIAQVSVGKYTNSEKEDFINYIQLVLVQETRDHNTKFRLSTTEHIFDAESSTCHYENREL